MTDHSAII